MESYEGSIPEMNVKEQVKLAKQAEKAGFASLFVRDVPLLDTEFGDAGQIHDPWVFLGYIAAHTERIGLGTGSIVTPLRHPLHVAKAAASLDRISGNRLILGLAVGDRPIEFSAFSADRAKRSQLFQESLHVIRRTWKESFPEISSTTTNLKGADLLPKPEMRDIPVLVTGNASQTPAWIAQYGDGWFFYQRNMDLQELRIKEWRSFTKEFKPFAQSLSLDLSENPNEEPTFIQLGFRSGRNYLISYLENLKEIGVNHVAFNFKAAKRPVDEMIQELGEEVVPHHPPLSSV
ncbi:LLM class oxidoreductase [Virgibacillus kimchii]